MAGVIQESARTLLAMINDLLDFSKIEAGRIDLDITELSVSGIAEDVIDLIEDLDPAEGLTVEFPSDCRECLIRVAGVDEVGRGCLAGPVVAAAVVVTRDCFINWNRPANACRTNPVPMPRLPVTCMMQPWRISTRPRVSRPFVRGSTPRFMIARPWMAM